ncbi:MAG: phosphotransferase [Cellulomonadaceae bacterium]
MSALLTDPALPGLDLVHSERRLSAWLGAPSRVRYVRHKPGVHLLAWVEATAADGVRVPVLLQVASADAEPKLDKLARAADRAETWFVRDPELRVVAAGAGADRDLPELRHVLPGARTLRYNPARRWVGQTERDGLAHLVKVFTQGGAERSVRAATLLAEHGVPTPPVAEVSGDTVRWPWWDGCTLEERPADVDVLGEVGLLLARLHAIGGQGDGMVFSHGDFSCDQVLRRPDGTLALLDLDHSGPARRTADLAAWLGDALSRAADRGAPATVASEVWAGFGTLLEAYEQESGTRVDRGELLDEASWAVQDRADEPARRLDPDAGGQRAGRLAVAAAVQELPVAAPPATVLVDARLHEVVRGWPRDGGEALLELAPKETEDAAPGTPTRGARWRAGQVTVHPERKDARLPAFASRLAAGERVVVHRPGRRAVLRGAGADAPYIKVLRAGRATDAVARHRVVQQALAGTAQVPDVVWHTPDAFALTPLHGPTLLRLGSDPGSGDDRFEAAWAALGRAVARLHATPASAAAMLGAEHRPRDEVATTRRWVDAALRWRLLPPMARGALDAALEPLVTQLPEPPRLVHRDLHDGQVIVTADGIGLLDLDTAAWAEPAIDVANVLVHLDLRVRQDLLSEDRRQRALGAFLDALEPSLGTRHRAGAYLTAARLRLSGVYALRPRWRALAAELAADALR